MWLGSRGMVGTSLADGWQAQGDACGCRVLEAPDSSPCPFWREGPASVRALHDPVRVPGEARPAIWDVQPDPTDLSPRTAWSVDW